MDRLSLQNKAAEFLKKYRYVILVVLVGIVLMSLPERVKETETPVQQPVTTEEADLEERLTQILSQIDGAGKVRVLLTEQKGQSVLYQTDEDCETDQDSLSEQRDTVIITDADRSEQGLIRQIDPPVYQGAVVVCQGADKATVRLAIVEAVSAATGLGADKISVLKMK